MTGLLNSVLHLTVWLALLALLFVPLEWLFAVRKGHRPRFLLTDLGFYYLNGLLPSLLMAIPLAALATLSRSMLPAAYVDAVAALRAAAKIALGLLIAETGSYWAHRWCHASPFWWRFHAVHHSVEHLSWLANTRAHPLDVVFTRICGLAPLYALGIAGGGEAGDAVLPLIITLVGTVWSFLVHANVRWRFGWLEQMIATPAFHHYPSLMPADFHQSSMTWIWTNILRSSERSKNAAANMTTTMTRRKTMMTLAVSTHIHSDRLRLTVHGIAGWV